MKFEINGFAAAPKPAFGRAAQHLAEPDAQKVKRLTTKADRAHHRAALTAAELLPDIPEPGEAVHCLMLGRFDLCQVVVATARKLPVLRALRIATLCYSKRNVADLCSLLDARATSAPPDPLPLTLLVSVFHRDHNKEEHAAATEELQAFPGTKVAAARSHCKVVCFDMGPGDALVIETSANLRTNHNREQLTAFRSRTLHDWHADWIDALVKADHGKPEPVETQEVRERRNRPAN